MARRHLLLATVALTATVAGLVLPAVGATSAVAGQLTFTQAQSIVVGDADSVPFPSVLDVQGVGPGVYDVDVTLSVSHDWPADLDVVLVAPDGTAATVMSDLGDGTPVSGDVLVFDDDAVQSPPADLAPGRYRPTDDDSDPEDPDLDPAPDSFADLAASSPVAGRWELYANDDTYDLDGLVDWWQLTFSVADIPTITTPTADSLHPGGTVGASGTGTPGTRVYAWLDAHEPRPLTVAADG